MASSYLLHSLDHPLCCFACLKLVLFLKKGRGGKNKENKNEEEVEGDGSHIFPGFFDKCN